MPSCVLNTNLPTQTLQQASFIDSSICPDANSDDALSAFRCVNGECHDTLLRQQPYTIFGWIRGVVMAHAYCIASIRLSTHDPTFTRHMLRTAWMPFVRNYLSY